MKLPEYEWVRFGKNPLKLVIGQVRFTTLLRIEQKSFIAGFQEAVRDNYPKVERESTVTFQISPTGVDRNSDEFHWRLSSRDNLWSVVLGDSALTLESRKYSSMADFLERFNRILEAVKRRLEISDCLRLGLRYINEFRYPGASDITDWRELGLLKPEFMGFEASSLLEGHISHVYHDVQIQRPDGILAIHHGLLDGFAVAPLPQQQPASGPFYLLDLDYYDTTERELDIPAILKQMQSYNDIIYRFFRWTLGKELYNYLEPLNAQRN